MAAFFFAIYRFLKNHRLVFFLAVPVIFALLAYWGSRINFEEDITKLIPTSDDAEQVSEIVQSVKFTDKIVVNITATDTGNIADLQEYADAFTDTLAREAAPYIQRIDARLEDEQFLELLDVVSRNLPLFLDEQDYRRIDSLMQPDSVTAKVRETYRAITSPQNLITAPILRQDPLGLTYLALRKFQQLQSGSRFTLHDGYLIAESNKNLFAFITPKAGASETAQNTEFVRILDQSIQALNAQFAGRASAEYFGATPMAVANARQIKQDIQVTLSIALVALIALFIYFYRRATIPLVILFPAAFGSLLGIAVLYWLKGTISAISIGIGSVLLGLTLDYSLHILSHYRGTGDVKRLFESTTKPLLMCAIFTAVDFACLLFLRSDVLKDLGIFAAVSVLGAAVFALVFIPQVYTPRHELVMRQNTFIDAIARYDFSRNPWVLGGALLLIIISLFTSKRVGFDDDLAALNYQPEHLKRAEQRLDSLVDYSDKSIYLVAYGDTHDAAMQRNTALYQQLAEWEAQGKIHSFQSVGGVAFSEKQQQERIDRWNGFWTTEKKQWLTQQLISSGQHVGFKENTFEPFFTSLSHSFTRLDPMDQRLLDTLFLGEFISTQAHLTTVTTVVKTDVNEADLLVQSLADTQSHVLAIDRKHLQERLLSNLETDFNYLLLIASIAVFVVIFVFFGSLELTLITNIPIFLGWLVTLGLMGAFHIQFNAFNIIIATLIFGLGVDYSIFVTKGLLEQYTYGSRDMPAYKAGVVMSALATILCFGMLVFAKHPAIKSISVIPLVGLLVVVLMSFSVQPWLFRTFISRPQERGNTPWRIVNFILTCFTFGYFFVGGLLVSISAQLLIPLIPVNKKKKLRVFHRVMQLFFHNLMYRTPGVRMQVVGRDASMYDTPAILIANHTSILDTPTMGLLHPMQLFMMNDRQLQSPFFGRAMRMVGAHPASDNTPAGMDRLRKKIEQGYSLIIFPEGTRSMTPAIQRFHKGAALLAEQLQLDIVPVLIHGNAHALPKYDNMLKPGPITMKYLPRIRHDDPAFGNGYRERTKKISAHFKQAFRAMRDELESPDYFKKKLLFNYVYKPRHVQKEVRRLFNMRKACYHELLRMLPLEGQYLHWGCGYGVLDFLLAYDGTTRQITAWDSDAEKVNVAHHTYTVNRYPVSFTASFPPIAAHEVLIITGDIPTKALSDILTVRWVVLEDVPNPDILHEVDASGFQLVSESDGIRVYAAPAEKPIK